MDRMPSRAGRPSGRVLYISGSIGLGHAARDLAIVAALRREVPGLQIDWLAGDPARRLIAEAGETVLEESSGFDETPVAEASAEAFSLNLADYVRRARGAWSGAIRAFAHVVTSSRYDVVVGDEAYEIAGALHAHPELRTAPFTMIYDFVGLDAMTWRPSERLMVHAANRAWCGGRRGRRPGSDLTLFIGEPEDVPDRRFGFLLPNRRAYARRYFEFVGYVFGFDPATYADRAKTRARLGYDDQPLIVCCIGGTSVGGDLLRLCAAAYPRVRAQSPDSRMVLVCGPRLDPSTVRPPAGAEVRAYVPRLYEHFAASDLVVTQGGGTTTLELTALRRPFVYFPLEGHFEQDRVVGKRLARHRAGTRLDYTETTPDMLADTIIALLGTQATWAPIPTDGAQRAARQIANLLSGRTPAMSVPHSPSR